MKILTIVTAMMLAQGCMSVHYVRNIGIRNEQLDLGNRDSVLATADGTIVLEVDATYTRPTIRFPMSESEVLISKKKRYMIGTPAALSNTVMRACSEAIDPTNIFTLSHFPRVGTNEPIWIVFPASFYSPSPSRVDLDAYLQGVKLTSVLLPMNYTYEGRHVRLKYGQWEQGYLDSGVKRRKIRAWWGYPCQVFLLPALAIDIVTSPIQIYLGLKEFDSHF